MEKFCDLHTHSVFSDGTCTPAQLVNLAEQKGLCAIALTDHNTAGGLKEFMEAGKNSSVITVPGCEFSTEWKGKEVHIVGLFFREKYWAEIEDFVELMNIAKHNSNLLLIQNLNAAGYDVSFEEAAALTGGGEFNRSHIARVLMQKGYMESVKQAFSQLLKEDKGFYVPAKKITSIAAIRFIKVYGAAAIMAHPFLNLNEKEMREFLPQAKEAGLDAIETRYSEFDEEKTQLAISLAEEFGIRQSGGSDFHGQTKPGIEIGTGRGKLAVPYEFYEQLLQCADFYK